MQFWMATDGAVPIASPAAWEPTAAPQPAPSRILTLDGIVAGTGDQRPVEDVTPPPPPAAPQPDRLAALRDIARRLRTAPDTDETLQFIVDTACRCTTSDAGMLTLTQPQHRQVTAGTALGAGPYISVQLRAGGPTFGELVLTRMSDTDEYGSGEETFAELVAEYVAKAVGAMRRGTVLSDEEQDFIDRITEELRSPVAGAVNLVGAVLDGQAGEISVDARAYLSAATRDTRRMLRMVDDLVALARMRPPEPRELEAMPVASWLQRGIDAVRADALAAGHTIELLKADAPYVVKALPPQMDLVLRHLLDNAIKFTDEPGRIEVSACLAEGMVRVCVSDPGIGFEGSEAARMLDCFARAVNAEAARIPGAGVGLFLASQIVKSHGGRLWLESIRFEGTQAYVALPPA